MPEPPEPDPAAQAPLDGEAQRGEIVAPGADGAPAELGSPDRGGLVHWLEQSHRDAQANRAQARELAHALEQVRDAHEYVGRALRDEQRRSRWLTAAVVLAPILAALVVWGIWDRLDASRAEIGDRVREVAAGQDELRRAQDALRSGAAAKAQEARADALDAELERARADLAGERGRASQAVLDHAAEDAALTAKIARLENENGETAGLRAQLQALRSRSGAEAARATTLEREIRRLERELGATAAAVSATGATTAPGTGLGTGVGTGLGTGLGTASLSPPNERASPGPETAQEPGATSSTAPAAPDPAAGAVRRPEDLARIREELNRLLGMASDSVTYSIDSIGGVRGDTLLDVRLSGVDGEGRPIRTLEAATASVHVRADEDDILIDLRDGHLLLAGRKAPFFDDRYAIVVDGESAAWRISGLTCVTFE